MKSKPCMNVCAAPLYHVLQPLPLFFVLFQLFPPCLLFLGSHSLEEPSLTHGFGLKGTQRHVSGFKRGNTAKTRQKCFGNQLIISQESIYICIYGKNKKNRGRDLEETWKPYVCEACRKLEPIIYLGMIIN